jgi:NAD(P)H-flavin reductase
MDNLYIPELARVVGIKQESPSIRSLELALQQPRAFDSVPGQFVELTVFGHGEFPVSLAGVTDAGNGRFRVTIQRAGKVTREIFSLDEGDQVGVRGPFGNGYPLERMRGKNILLVAGGVGLAAMWYLIKYLHTHQDDYGALRLFYGARGPGDLIYKEDLLAWEKENDGLEVQLIVDQEDSGWTGRVGFVSELLTPESLNPEDSIAAVCGPGPMMKATTEALTSLGLDSDRILVSMERRMQCGMGACGHCMVGRHRVCLDGPVFSLDQTNEVVEERF